MLQISSELAAVLVMLAAGLMGWLTNMSFKMGSIKSTIETEQQVHKEQISAHGKQLRDHENRISTLEAAK